MSGACRHSACGAGRKRCGAGGGDGRRHDVGAGPHLYMQDCAVCHRPDGAGGKHLGKAASADLRAPALEAMYHNDDQLLARAILTGVAEDGGRLDSVMPRWVNRLSPADVAEIIAYLKQLKGGEGALGRGCKSGIRRLPRAARGLVGKPSCKVAISRPKNRPQANLRPP